MSALAAGLAMLPRFVAAARTELERTNHAGRHVTLAEGVAVAAGVVVLTARGGRAADAAWLAGIAALGVADDVLEPRQRRRGQAVSKGLAGHLGALSRGQLTTGGAKALGIPMLALAGAASAPGPRRVLGEAVLTAGCANLANLLDLRPGRALKAVLAPATVLAALPAGTPRARSARSLAVAAAIPALLALPADLGERGMLGDGGANILGAAVGSALARRARGPLLPLLVTGVCALNLASERVSFSAVIADTPWLRRLDEAGRLHHVVPPSDGQGQP